MFAAIIVCGGGQAWAGSATDSGYDPAALKELSVEELMNIEITLVSRLPQRLSEAPAAVQVITGDEIRRSGASSLVDALALFPNLGVQQLNSYARLVSARGFTSFFSNKLLVMIDGRSVYTPVYAGVYWDAQNVVLEDIDRIEVISGPGGALWGANAVNGIINIITKDSEASQGVYASATAGSFREKSGVVRFGDNVGEKTSYRIFAQRDKLDNTYVGETENLDAWIVNHGGFRIDHHASPVDEISVHAHAYSGNQYNMANDRSEIDGQSIIGRWEHEFSPSSALQAHVYFDRTWRDDLVSTVRDELHTIDFDAQHSLMLGERHRILWGAGYRFTRDAISDDAVFSFLPSTRDMSLYSFFLQDEIAAISDVFALTLGSKIEHNVYSGFEVQPGIRMALKPGESHFLWGAISRAVRSPSRIDVDYYVPATPPFAIAGGPDFKSEVLNAYEVGYRTNPSTGLSVSVSTFYNTYDDIFSLEPANMEGALPYTFQNGVAGESWGAEVSGMLQLLSWCKIRGGYTYFEKRLWGKPGHNVSQALLDGQGNDPTHQAVLQYISNLPANLQFDLVGRYVDALPSPFVPSYITLDARLGWSYQRFEVAIVGKNLAEERHVEVGSAEIPRSVYVSLAFRE